MGAADLVSKLRAFHNESQVNEARAGFRFCGLDLVKGCIRDNKKAGKLKCNKEIRVFSLHFENSKYIFLGVFEPTKIKTKSLKLAAKAATNILRIDDQINLYPTEKKEKSYSDALAAGGLDG